MLIEPMLQRLQAARSLEDTLQVALADVVALHGAERGSLQLFDPQGDLAFVSHVGLSRAVLSSPLLCRGESLGVVSAHFANPFVPSALELQSLETDCGHVAEANAP